MKILQLILIGFALSLAACESDYSSSQNAATTDDSTAVGTDTAVAMRPPAQPQCDTTDPLLEGNEKWMASEQLLIRILATQATRDAQLGDSHRHLEVRNANCELLFSTKLEVDQSPDFPYTIARINYNKVNGWLAIQGFSQFYLLHLPDLRLEGPLKPAYLNERYAEDAQSGRINKLEVWEDYLIGQAEDLGTFVFSLREEDPKPVLPLAEYSADGGFEYHSLFMLQSGQEAEKYQLLLPTYNATTSSLEINPLLQSPTRIDGNLNPAFRNNRYLVIKAFDEDGQRIPIAIDMLLQQRISLPDEVARMKDTDIIAWMRSNS